MMNIKNDFPKYVAEIFTERLKELGKSKYRFVRENPIVNQPTLDRLLRGEGSTNIKTMAYYAEVLGLEVIIRKKRDTKQ